MKAFLRLLLFLATQWAYCAGKPFVPMTEAQEAELRHIVTVMREAADETRAQLDGANALNSDLQAAVKRQAAELGSVRDAQRSAQEAVTGIQQGIDADKATIETQRAQLGRWKTFGRAVLALIAAAAFALAWRCTPGLGLGIPMRLCVCAMAGAAGAWLVFFVITRLL